MRQLKRFQSHDHNTIIYSYEWPATIHNSFEADFTAAILLVSWYRRWYFQFVNKVNFPDYLTHAKAQGW